MVEVTQKLLKEHFEYRDGHLWWIKPTARRTKIGDKAGTDNYTGYRNCRFFTKLYREHRLIWLYHYGVWPDQQLDHINGVKSDNRIENLRKCTNQQNSFNKKSNSSSSSSYKGVHWKKRDKVWVAQYTLNGKITWIGSFETEQEAAEAYRKTTESFHQEYANYG